jgi:hypothetical protein
VNWFDQLFARRWSLIFPAYAARDLANVFTGYTELRRGETVADSQIRCSLFTCVDTSVVDK